MAKCDFIVLHLPIIILILFYYPFSIGLTFYQKWVLTIFKYPITIVCCHYIFKFSVAAILRYFHCRMLGNEKPVTLDWRNFIIRCAPIGIAAAIDIALSNWSFEFITISLYTMSKSTCIVFILIFALLLGLERLSILLVTVIFLIAVGLFLFTYKSSQFDLTGFLLVEIAAMCAGIRWALSQFLMQNMDGHSLKSPVDLMFHVQPWMIMAVLPMLFIIEGETLATSAQVFSAKSWSAPLYFISLIVGGAFIATTMELAEYLILSKTSSLTLNVCGIIKEVVSLFLAHIFHGDEMSLLNLLGLVSCILGICLYAYMKAQKTHINPDRQSKCEPNRNELCKKEDYVMTSMDSAVNLQRRLLSTTDDDDSD